MCRLTKLLLCLIMAVLPLSIASGQEAKYSTATLEPAKIPDGAKVSNAKEARDIAREAYRKKMRLVGPESFQTVSVILEVLGFDLPGFGKTEDKIWEVRIMRDCGATKDRRDLTRGIIWVHSETAEVYFVIGPWVADEKKEKE